MYKRLECNVFLQHQIIQTRDKKSLRLFIIISVMNQCFRNLLCFWLPLFFFNAASLNAQTNPIYYYVAPSGKDLNPGTEALPWKTLAKAVSMATANVTVFIKHGTYNERLVPVNSGTADGPVTFASYPGDSVIINGVGINFPVGQSNDKWFNGLIHIQGLKYIRISGLRVINSGASGILVSESSFITIEENYTDSTYSPGIVVNSSDNIVAQANEVVHGCMGGDMECISVSATNLFEIKNNRIHDGFTEGIDVKVGSSNGIVSNNVVYNQNASRMPAGIYIDAWDSHEFNIDVYDNIIHDNGHGFDVGSENGGLTEGIRIHHNKAYNNNRGFWLAGWGIGQTHPCKNIAIYGNEFYNNQFGIEIGGFKGTTFESIEIFNNLIYRNKSAGVRITRYDEPTGDYVMRNVSIINNTIYGNGTLGNGWDADNAGMNLFNIIPEKMLIRNNIISNNAYCTIYYSPEVPADSVTIDYNFFDGFQNFLNEKTGTNAVYGIPSFVDTLMKDYHLQGTSACIDKGDPDQQYNDPGDPNKPGYALFPAQGTIQNDMGAYGGPYSTSWDTATSVTAPSIPTLGSPSNDVTGVPNTLLLNWNGFTRASSYRLQVSTSSSFSPLVIDQNGIKGLSSGIGSLASNTLYYWRVNATNAGGTSSWSEIWSFTTAYLTWIKEQISSDIIRIYPVPVDGILRIDGIDNEYTTISILSQEGKILKQIKGRGIQEIDLSELQKGVYLIKISNSQTVITKKIVKL